MKEQPDNKSAPADGMRSGKHHCFKKTGKHKKHQSHTASEFFRAVAFCSGREGPKLYS